MRRSMKRQTLAFTGALAAVLVATFTSGCGGSGEDEMETAIETQMPGGGNVEIESDKGMVTIENEDGKIQAGESVDLPRNFPDDIPVPEGITWNLVQNLSDGDADNFTAQGMLQQSVSEVATYMKEQLTAAGWEPTDLVQQSDEIHIIKFDKGERALSVTISELEDGTTLVISTQ